MAAPTLFDMEDAQGLVEAGFVRGATWALKNAGKITGEALFAAAKERAAALPAELIAAMEESARTDAEASA